MTPTKKRRGYRIYVCGGDETLALDERERDCPNVDEHTPHPLGYGDWHDWAARMSKTHTQRRCTGCQRWAIWDEDK